MLQDNKEAFKKMIIIFWALWWLTALWTDIVGSLAHFGWLIKSWAPDTNYPFLLNSLKMYPLPEWGPPLLFIGILLWSLLSTVVFCWACVGLNKDSKIWMRRADIAFIVSLGYWLAFFLADQLVMKFDLEENHMVQGGFQLLTYLTLYLLPSTPTKK
ncbi:hypothetical protein [Legionella maioricensis]|uniref:Transmembrane protein n=1 Tax=Legionella maioricensis TaxID=2896528 RepID=A0A9X2D219_9GAMM|nr:hypothetical protein [Legionella maioricensis]MCL9684842.1 hypothetical protein [Legionella maioricensis]MCL9688522.1 hypothetical protein [Legionella maioricensis]